MLDAALCRTLAEVAQTLWCRHMEGLGWRLGSHDCKARTHDALVPFDRLGAHDRRRLLDAVAELQLEPVLLEAVDHQRGPDREFTLEEMRPGLPVAYAEGSRSSDPGRDIASERGVIESWTAKGDQLDVFRVRWADGTLAEYYPCERDLRRLGW
jgi:hypothetical protein